jgi:hypothetical protein
VLPEDRRNGTRPRFPSRVNSFQNANDSPAPRLAREQKGPVGDLVPAAASQAVAVPPPWRLVETINKGVHLGNKSRAVVYVSECSGCCECASGRKGKHSSLGALITRENTPVVLLGECVCAFSRAEHTINNAHTLISL